MSAHSPTPWKLDDHNGIYSHRKNGGTSMVAFVNANANKKEFEANRIIIAASPAMLEELKRLDGLGVSVDWDRFPELQKNGMTPR